MAVAKNRSCSPLVEWGRWSPWSSCGKSCDAGWRTRERFCLRNGVRTDDVYCSNGEASERQRCNVKPCPVWASWSDWSQCSKSCGTAGVRQRGRVCLHGKRENCAGSNETTVQCNVRPCPTWSSWSSWSTCSATCGTGGQMLQARSCLHGNTTSCGTGAKTKSTPCSRRPCPTWGSWGPWGACSVTCGPTGRKTRNRYCENGLPGSPGCHSPVDNKNQTITSITSLNMTSQVKNCVARPCSQWSQWLPWSGCSKTCGQGLAGRRRFCLKIVQDPSIDEVASAERRRSVKTKFVKGGSCVGTANDTKECNVRICPTWSQWGGWTTCTATCGKGAKFRSRDCLNAMGNNSCPGNATQGTFCNSQICPPPTCQNISANFSHGNFECTNGTFVGSQCYFDCYPGYVIRGPPVTQCGESGSWNPVRPKCQKMQLNVTTFVADDIPDDNTSFAVTSLSSGVAGTWMVNEDGDVFCLNNSIGHKAFSTQYSNSLQWTNVDKRGMEPCPRIKTQAPHFRIRVTGTKVTLFIPECRQTYSRRGISLASPSGWYWQRTNDLKPTGDFKEIKSAVAVWKLNANGNISLIAPSSGPMSSDQDPLEGSILSRESNQTVPNPVYNGSSLPVHDFCVANSYVFVVTEGVRVFQRKGVATFLPQGVAWEELTNQNQPPHRTNATNKNVISCLTSQWQDKVLVWVADYRGRFTRYAFT